MVVFITAVTVLMLLLGLAGAFLPLLPGAPLILLGSVIYGLGMGFDQIGTSVYIILVVLTVFSFLVDYLAASLGARRWGASKAGVIGAIVGGVVGFLVGSFPGLFIGPFVGAFLGELVTGRGAQRSLEAGLGALVGFLGGVLTRLLIALVMVGLVVYRIVV